MAKVSVGDFLRGMLAAGTGQIAGRLEGERQRREIEAQQAQQKAQAFTQQLHAFEIGRGLEAEQHEREQQYDQLLGSFYPDLDTESKGKMRQFLLERGHLRAMQPSQFGPEQFRALPGNPLGGAAGAPATPNGHPGGWLGGLTQPVAPPGGTPPPAGALPPAPAAPPQPGPTPGVMPPAGTPAGPGTAPTVAPTKGATITLPGGGPTLTFSNFNKDAAAQLQKAVHERFTLLQNTAPTDEAERKRIAGLVKSAPAVIGDEQDFAKGMAFLNDTADLVPGSSAAAMREMKQALQSDVETFTKRATALPKKSAAGAARELPEMLRAEQALQQRLGPRAAGTGLFSLYANEIGKIEAAQKAGDTAGARRIAKQVQAMMGEGVSSEDVAKERRSLLQMLPNLGKLDPSAQRLVLDEIRRLYEMDGIKATVPARIVPQLAPDVKQRLANERDRIKLEGERVAISRANLGLARERQRLQRQSYTVQRPKMPEGDRKALDSIVNGLLSGSNDPLTGDFTPKLPPEMRKRLEDAAKKIGERNGLDLGFLGLPDYSNRAPAPSGGAQSYGAPRRQPGGPPVLVDPRTGTVTPPGAGVQLAPGRRASIPDVRAGSKKNPTFPNRPEMVTGLSTREMEGVQRDGVAAAKAGRLPATLADTRSVLAAIQQHQGDLEGFASSLPKEQSRLFWRIFSWQQAGGKLTPTTQSAPSGAAAVTPQMLAAARQFVQQGIAAQKLAEYQQTNPQAAAMLRQALSRIGAKP